MSQIPIISALSRYPFWRHVKAHRHAYFWGIFWLFTVDLINVLLPLLVKESIDAIPSQNLHRIFWAAVGYLGLMAFQAVGRYLWRVYLMGTATLIARDLRLELYNKLQKLPVGYYQKVRTGDLMSRATNDIESIRLAVGPGILVTLDALLMFVFIVPVMFYLSVKLSLLAFAFYPMVPWLTAKLGDRIDKIFEDLQSRMSRMSAFVQESFGAIRLIKSLVLESRIHHRFEELSRDYQKQGILQAKYSATFSPVLGLLTNLGTFLILLLGGKDVMDGAITIGTFVAFQRFVVQLSWPMEAIGWAVTMNREGAAADRRLNEVLSETEVNSVRGEGKPFPSSEKAPRLLEIKDLHFSYAAQTQESSRFELGLDRLELAKGKKIGIVGPVGSGKTTFFNLLMRLYEPEAGSIFLRGKDIVDIPLEELRQTIASVEQQVFLFSEKINRNVALGAENRISKAEIEASSHLACLFDEISELELGFEMPLGERGVNLSGGQKQRLALMRALVRKPVLLLLDDAFSAVDVAVEQKIIENFFSVYPDMSLLFATHRLSVMPRMDEVWIFDKGRVAGRGTHEALLATHPLYQKLWEKSEGQGQILTLDLGLSVAEPFSEVKP